MLKRITPKAKMAIYRVQARVLQKLQSEYPDTTVAAAKIGTTYGTLQNWASNYKTPRLMSPRFAIHLEKITKGRYLREHFRPDLFVKGWKP